MRDEVRVVRPAERARVRGAELRQMQAVEDIPPAAIQSSSDRSRDGSMSG